MIAYMRLFYPFFNPQYCYSRFLLPNPVHRHLTPSVPSPFQISLCRIPTFKSTTIHPFYHMLFSFSLFLSLPLRIILPLPRIRYTNLHPLRCPIICENSPFPYSPYSVHQLIVSIGVGRASCFGRSMVFEFILFIIVSSFLLNCEL